MARRCGVTAAVRGDNGSPLLAPLDWSPLLKEVRKQSDSPSFNRRHLSEAHCNLPPRCEVSFEPLSPLGLSLLSGEGVEQEDGANCADETQTSGAFYGLVLKLVLDRACTYAQRCYIR